MTTPRSQPGQNPAGYVLSPQTAELCLPVVRRDPNRKLAQVDSICALFLLVGTVGFYAPPIPVRPVAPVTDPVGMQWEETETTEDQPKAVETTSDADSDAQSDPAVSELPPIVQPLGPQAFPVYLPTVRPRLLSLLPAPAPRDSAAPSSAPRWREVFAGASGGGEVRPAPEYPWRLKEQRMQGSVVLRIIVGENGVPQEVLVHQTSGYPELDLYTRDWVKKHWRWPAGGSRLCSWKCDYVLQH